ncbi:hypothetical protein OROHE_026745 [Orobanche hederae]
MENGIGIADDAKLELSNCVNSEVLEQSVKEKVDFSLNGSKDSDVDEVFEEAVEEETAIVGPESSKMTKDGDVELGGTLENKENSDLCHGVHEFEGVTKAPGVVQNSKDTGALMRISTTEENHCEKHIDLEEKLMDETNGLMDDGITERNDSSTEDGKGDYIEILDSAAGESESLNDKYEKLDAFYRKPEDNISDKKSFLEALDSGEAKISGADTREKTINETETEDADSENLDVEAFPRVCSGIPQNGSLDHLNSVSALNHEDMKSADADALKEQIQKTAHEIELTNEWSAGNQHDELENNLAILHSELKEGQVDEQEAESCLAYANADDDENTKLKKLDLESAQVERANNQDVDQEENSGIAASNTSATNHAKEGSELDTNLYPVLDDVPLNLEKTEVEPLLVSSEAESSKSFQTELVNPSTEVSTNIIGRQGEEGVEDDRKELYLSGNGEQDKVQEPVFQGTSANNEKKEIKSSSNISSVNSVTTQPAGPSQSTPLPDLASQNKERRSKPTPDISPTTFTSPTPARPAGLGRAAPLLEPTSRIVQHPRVNGAIPTPQTQLMEDTTNIDVEEYDETREKLQMIRVKFLRLAHRIGQTPHNVVVAQVLYRLGLAEQLRGRSRGRAAFSFDRASAVAEQLEAAGKEPLDFTCTIMVLGKSGVGKSATINSIFDEVMFGTDAFQLGTKKAQDIVGTIQGIRVHVIDTPGLLPSWSDQHQNEKTLHSVKRFIKKTPPDIVLYLDRLDMQCRDFGDTPLLRTITGVFGPSIWFNAIVVLTHAASAPPEGPNGTTTSYDMFVTERSHVILQAIRQAAGDMRLMNPVSLVENHSACRTNRAGQRILPNGQVWKSHLLLLSFASKILAEANTLLKMQDTPPGRPSATRPRNSPLPFLLSSLLQSRPETKLPSEQFGGDDDDNDVMDDDLDECSDSEGETEYDELPPFKSLTKAELENLSKAQRKAYYDELEYRERLFMKKQLREERKRRKLMKKLQEAARDVPVPAEYGDNNEEASSASSVPVPMPDLALPASFDSDNPTHRYRSLDSSNPWLVRAVLDLNGWDHDIGYEGINVERLFAFKEKVPISFSGHISKDKKDASLQMEIASSVKHGKGKSTSIGFDMLPLGKDFACTYAYTLRSETRISNHKMNKATAGLSATVVGDVITGGVKVEDKLKIGKRGQLVVSGGSIYSRGEVLCGGSLAATLRDKDHPLGRSLLTLGLSVMDRSGDVAIGCNSQTQIPIGRNTNLIGRFNVSNRGNGQLSVKISSSEQLQIALIGLIPLVKKILGYSQQAQYG